MAGRPEPCGLSQTRAADSCYGTSGEAVSTATSERRAVNIGMHRAERKPAKIRD
jgi:hypothetical protein